MILAHMLKFLGDVVNRLFGLLQVDNLKVRGMLSLSHQAGDKIYALLFSVKRPKC